jgi:hypothetical protein
MLRLLTKKSSAAVFMPAITYYDQMISCIGSLVLKDGYTNELDFPMERTIKKEDEDSEDQAQHILQLPSSGSHSVSEDRTSDSHP